jgi:glycerate kinase
MKVLLAPDKFKGSLTAAEVARHLANGLDQRGIAHTALPLADGGDGSVQAAIESGFRRIRISVAGATGYERPTVAAFDGTTAVIEVANTCGLHTLPGGKLEPLSATSTGFGQAIVSVMRHRPRRIVLALGGSASTDGGAGMLAALGARFLDDQDRPVAVNGGTLHRIRSIDTSGLHDLTGTEIIIAGDVQNPLTGSQGAAAVYAPQKGATPDLVTALDNGLIHLVQQLTVAGIPDAQRFADTPGAGAAGGLGFAGLLLGGRTVSGADFFLDLLKFETHLLGCDLVITGEGRMDEQTLNGKLPAIVARRAGRIPVIAVVGRCDITPKAQAEMGIQAVYAIADDTTSSPASDPLLSGRLLEEFARTLLIHQLAAATNAGSATG